MAPLRYAKEITCPGALLQPLVTQKSSGCVRLNVQITDRQKDGIRDLLNGFVVKREAKRMWKEASMFKSYTTTQTRHFDCEIPAHISESGGIANINQKIIR